MGMGGGGKGRGLKTTDQDKRIWGIEVAMETGQLAEGYEGLEAAVHRLLREFLEAVDAVSSYVA